LAANLGALPAALKLKKYFDLSHKLWHTPPHRRQGPGLARFGAVKFCLSRRAAKGAAKGHEPLNTAKNRKSGKI
jgi:hypothetical protein